MAIAEIGLKEDYGANIGKIIFKRFSGENYIELAKAYAAAASDARMGGCDMPVIINSGSGNQGITTSVPVIVYAKELDIEEDKLYRALVLSNLLTIHQKCFIGKLSAYCGVVNAGASAACGIAYLYGGDYQKIIHTLVNAVAIASGMVCDGAKPSCAAKLAIAIESGILGFEMIENGQEFFAGDGIVSNGVENTIRNIGRLGKD
jgi:L-cysteine desulfidase